MTHPETERYFTQKLGLTAPSIDDEVSAMRENWYRLDEAYSGAVVVNPGVVPDDSVLYDGCIVSERNTGIVWRAQRNNAGAFEKKYIKYPWSISLAQAPNNFNITSPGIWGAWGYQVFEGGSINANPSDLVNNRLVIPITGVYVGRDDIHWYNAGTVNHFAHTLWKNDNNGTAPTYNDWYEQTWEAPVDGGDLSTTVPINEKFNKGDTICAGVWQNSDAPRANFHRLQLSLLRVAD